MIHRDPQGHEISSLTEHAGSWEGLRVLEVGCGNGRLTWRYAHQAAQVVGIDPNQGKIAQAQAEMPPELRGKVEMLACSLEEYASAQEKRASKARFDRAILSWSL